MKSRSSVGIALLILAIMLCSPITRAYEHGHAVTRNNTASNTAPPSSEVLLVKQRDELRLAGFEAFYSVDYEQATDKFERLISLDPEHPAGYIYQAANLWLRQVHKTRRLQTSLYNNMEFRSDIITSPVSPDEKLDKQFRSLIETACAKAEERIKRDSRDIESLYLLGTAYATLAGYDATVGDKRMAAMRAGSKAVDIHKKVLKLDPNFIDAYLTIGIYDYVVANLPLAVRMMGSIFGLRGNEKRGLAAIERVAREGKYRQDDAKIMLIAIYQREKRYDDALNMMREFQQRYPKNYLLPLETAAMLIRSERQTEAFAAFEKMLNQQDRQTSFDLIRFHYGDALLASGKFTEAANQFIATASQPNCDRELLVLARFRAGQAYDLAKNRERAIEEYNEVLKSDNIYNLHSRAKEYIKKPYVAENK